MIAHFADGGIELEQKVTKETKERWEDYKVTLCCLCYLLFNRLDSCHSFDSWFVP